MSHVFDEGIESAIQKLESPDRLQWHEPFSVLRRFGLREGMTLADLGCGTGFFTVPAAEIVGPSGLVYAVDSEAEVLEVLKRKIHDRSLSNIKVSKEDLLSAGIPARSVDLVLLACVYHDIHRKDLLGNEIRRILRSGGKLGLVDWKKMETPRGPPIHERLNEEEAKSSLKSIRFECVLEFEPGSYHYAILAEPI